MNTSKEFRQWAKSQGAPVPKHIDCEALRKDGKGAFLLGTINIHEDFESRVAYLENLCIVARRAGKYARIIYQNEIGVALLVDMQGDFAKIDAEALYDLQSLILGGEIR